VKLALYDLAGRRVRTLVERDLSAGRYSERWDATDDQGNATNPGIYLLRARLGERETTQRLLLIR
jgi:flagellar hook assembly protein FlgD